MKWIPFIGFLQAYNDFEDNSSFKNYTAWVCQCLFVGSALGYIMFVLI
jgi:hypothetical protein